MDSLLFRIQEWEGCFFSFYYRTVSGSKKHFENLWTRSVIPNHETVDWHHDHLRSVAKREIFESSPEIVWLSIWGGVQGTCLIWQFLSDEWFWRGVSMENHQTRGSQGHSQISMCCISITCCLWALNPWSQSLPETSCTILNFSVCLFLTVCAPLWGRTLSASCIYVLSESRRCESGSRCSVHANEWMKT